MHPYAPSRFSAVLSIAAVGVCAGLVVPACGGDSAPVEDGDADVPDHVLPDGAPEPDASESDAQDSGPSCAPDAGLVLCGTSCVDTRSDSKHCGGCNRACAAKEACKSSGCKPVCRIDGAMIDQGGVNPANVCTHCDTALADRQWSPRPNGTACAAGKVCAAGSCDAQCFIDGALVASGAGKPADACQKCDPSITTTAWTPRAIGETCGSGKVCESGACNAKCFIGGTFYAANAVNPANACEQCVPGSSTTAWSRRTEIPLLTVVTDVTTQGWSVASGAPATLANGTDYVSLTTSTAPGARSGGQLLLYYPAAYTVGTAFKFRVVMLVQSVASHNQFDSAAAILGAYTPSFGTSTERGQMLYLDSAKIGWADDSPSTPAAPFNVTDGAYHTYEFSVDAAGVARVSVDGAPKLTRSGFVGNGTIAIGDQTNDGNLDSTLQIRSVSRVCP